ncbi:MAG: TolB family protein, partial [Phycisphaerales bacterium]
MSPDGQSVLFARKVVNARNAYETSLWLADAEGVRAPRALTRGPRHSGGRWSPDGTAVAYVRADRDRPPCIEVVSARGGRARAVATMPHGTIRDLAWSPCGTRVAFAFRPLAAAWTPEAAKVRTARGGSTPPRVIDDAWYRLDGDGYFDGARFALFVADVAGGRTSAECVFDRDTLGSFSFDWAPDGSSLIVATNMHPRASWEPWHTTLVVVTPGRGGRHRVAELRGLPPGVKRLPSWSPDGMR